MGGFQKILEKYHMEKWLQKENLIVLILVGILLIVIALPTKGNNADDDKSNSAYGLSQDELWADPGNENGSYGNSSGLYGNSNRKHNSEVADGSQEAADYITTLEEKLTSILSHIQGIGEVYVMITLQESEEMVVEKDLLEEREQTIYETEGNASVPYVIKTIFPKVEGVVVVAEGAGTGRISQNITEMVQALFDIEIHKIKVVKG